MRAAEMAPRLSGGVAHAMAVMSVSALNDRAALSTKAVNCAADLVLKRATSSGRSGPVHAGNPGHKVALVPRAMTQPDAACASRVIVAVCEVSDVSTIRATLDTSAITQLMFDLCSAPCKARRFAPPALTRGLRALTVPARRSRLGHYVMVGSLMTLSWTDLDR